AALLSVLQCHAAFAAASDADADADAGAGAGASACAAAASASAVGDGTLAPTSARAGLFGCVVQLAYSPLSTRSIVMHCSTGHTCMHRLQPTHSESNTSKCRTPSFSLMIAW